MRRRLLIPALAGVLLTPPSSLAQAAPEPASAPGPAHAVAGLTVTPPPPGDRAALRPRLRAFVAAYGAPAPVGQLARWRDEVCPLVTGLSPQADALVAARIRGLAAEVGAPVAAGAPCRRTVSVFFTAEPQQAIDKIRTGAPMFLGYHYPSQTRGLATFKGPVEAWRTTATEGADGREWLDDTRYRQPGGDPGSRITSQISGHLAGVVVIADRARMADYGIGAIADYIAVLALAQSSPPQSSSRAGCRPLPTVTNLFLADCPAELRPDRATEADVAYLKVLYSTDPRLKLDFQQAELAAKMERLLAP